jgi:radical SAM superfamily enzyme YgiQ (UPF0313 family)
VAIPGESEFTAADLLAARKEGRSLTEVPGLVLWDGDRSALYRTPERPQVDDLDELPFIDYGLFDLKLYRKFSFPVPIHKRVQWGHVLATRGCPYPCTHCSFDHRQTFGRKFRKHSPKYFVDNLELLVKQHGVNAVSVEDDIFTLQRDYVLEICDEIERRGLKLKWVVQTRVDCIDPELLARMKRAGCCGLSLGIESGNDRVLKMLKKGFTRQQAADGIRMAEEAGMMLRLLYMIGNPTETAEEIEDTIDLTCRAKAITIQVHISTPYPGTGLLGEAEGDGQHIEDFSSYNQVVCNMSAVPDEQLWQLQKKFYRKYFFSWRYFMVFMRQRAWYMLGSWRHDIPLVLRVLWYLVFASQKQEKRDVDRVLERIQPHQRQAIVRQASAAADAVALPVMGGQPDSCGAEKEEALASVGSEESRNGQR